MAVNRSRGDDESHEIRIPSLIMDQIKTKEDKGHYVDDGSRSTKFDHKINDKKRKVKPKRLKKKEITRLLIRL